MSEYLAEGVDRCPSCGRFVHQEHPDTFYYSKNEHEPPDVYCDQRCAERAAGRAFDPEEVVTNEPRS